MTNMKMGAHVASIKTAEASSVARYAFVEVKAFGDLTVTARTLRDLPRDTLARCALVVAPHLTDLVNALAPSCTVETLALSDDRLPAIFDLKARGLPAGIGSALSLRRALSGAAKGATLVLPRAHRRERFIAGGRPMAVLPPAENVYVAQEQFVARYLTSAPVACVPRASAAHKRIAFCLYSRVAAKNVPLDLAIALSDLCAKSGFEAEFLLLDGEHLDGAERLNTRRIPRRFDALASALADYAGVLSADSLPAHLAEYCGTPAFVASPVSNRYWLPADAFKQDHWGVFGQRDELFARFQRFLDMVKP
ncbi:hypothetical protein [Pandoraea sp. PE-S2R-1]|uniref:hypothetical protein n=1 Tax=Pandoraea sp. PE-S2R-1 TaxID=1986994 RepID=UPI000B4015B9|nr:hypothetical protein [Pandoraea sp. PE-S2R-1]